MTLDEVQATQLLLPQKPAYTVVGDGGMPERSSFASCVCNLTIAILGPGLLSVPFALSASGLLLGSGMMVLAAVLNVYTVMLLLDFSTNLPPGMEPSFEAVVRYHLGPRCERFLLANLALYLFGCVCGNLIAMMSMGHVFVQWCGVNHLSQRMVLLIIVVCVELPLCSIQDVGTLGRFSSPLGVFALCAVSGVVVSQAVRTATDFGWPPVDAHLYPPSAKDLLLTFPIATFSFSAQPYVLPLLYQQLLPERLSSTEQKFTEPQRKEAQFVVWGAMAICFCLYMITGVFGVLTLRSGRLMNSNVLMSYPSDDPVGCITSAIMTLAVATCLPINIFPLRQLFNPGFGHGNLNRQARKEVLISVFILASATAVACTVSDLGWVFDITGATACLTCCYVLPCILVLRKLEAGALRRTWGWNSPAVFTLVVGTTGSLFSLWSIFASSPAG